MKKLSQLNHFLEKHGLVFLKYIAVFFVILFGFHFFYNAFLKPIATMEGYNHVWLFLQQQLYAHSTWTLEHIIGYNIFRDGFLITFPNHGSILVDETCSATKWLLHFLVLMLIFPGPWKHKAWFIPSGLLMVHLISVIRIVGLSIVYVNRPESWDFFHDYIFRPFFYAMLFLVWVFWVERFVLKRKAA